VILDVRWGLPLWRPVQYRCLSCAADLRSLAARACSAFAALATARTSGSCGGSAAAGRGCRTTVPIPPGTSETAALVGRVAAATASAALGERSRRRRSAAEFSPGWTSAAVRARVGWGHRQGREPRPARCPAPFWSSVLLRSTRKNPTKTGPADIAAMDERPVAPSALRNSTMGPDRRFLRAVVKQQAPAAAWAPGEHAVSAPRHRPAQSRP
jgi:hypothetical protein